MQGAGETQGSSASDPQVLEELEATRKRALSLEHQLFELRALLQSGKGFSQIFKVEDLLQAFMAVCRERCDAVSSAVLLEVYAEHAAAVAAPLQFARDT